MKKIWPFSFYALFFASVAFVTPFMVLYYNSLGFSGIEIGLLTGITPLFSFFSAPLWTSLADTTHRHRLIMSVVILLFAVSIFAFSFLTTFWSILLIVILFNVFSAPISPFADSATLFMLGDKKEMYGRMRLGGTIGFGLVAPLAGIIVQNYGLKFVFWGGAVCMLLGFMVSQQFRYSPVQASSSAKVAVRTLLMNRRWQLFLLLALVGGIALAAANNFLLPYMQELGADGSTMGFALMIGTIGEIPVLFFGNRLTRFFKPYGLFVLTVVITGVRLLLFAASTTPTFVLIFQALNGLTFPAMWLAGVAYADENAPAGMSATAQGMFGAVALGIGASVGGLAGGPLLDIVGSRGVFMVFGITVLVTVAFVVLMQKRLPAERMQSASVEAIE